MNYEDQNLHLLYEEMISPQSLPISQHSEPSPEQNEPEVNHDHEQTELKISKDALDEINALLKISRGNQCGSLTNKIYYRCTKLRDLLNQLYDMHRQYDPEDDG